MRRIAAIFAALLLASSPALADVAVGNGSVAVPVPVVGGGTGANLSATGGASQYLQQSSVGGAVTVGQPVSTNLSDYFTGTFTPTDTSGASLSITVTSAGVVKVGKSVIASYYIVYPATGSTASASISTPYTANVPGACALAYNPSAVTTTVLINGANVLFYNTGTGVQTQNIALTAKTLAFTCTYQSV